MNGYRRGTERPVVIISSKGSSRRSSSQQEELQLFLARLKPARRGQHGEFLAGLLENGDAGGGVLPQGKKAAVGCFGFGAVSRRRVGARPSEKGHEYGRFPDLARRRRYDWRQFPHNQRHL